MICPVCQTPNREGANFCKNCGGLMIQACPRCDADLPEEANYCDNCGLRLIISQDDAWWEAGQTASPEKPSAPPVPLSSQVAPAPNRPPPAIIVPPASPEASLSHPAQPAVDSPLQKYIPNELLKKLEAARTRGEMVGERRVVTMLFCDVKGSTAAADQLDPEEWSDIINGAFDHMIGPVYKYEGTVARLMGDSILAFFGAPIAHEDDAHRAVLAGLDIVAAINPYREQIRQRYKIDFDVRVGINTGLVVVGAVGSDLRMEYTALGDAINLAARMEQTAQPGTVQIAQDTYKLVSTLFDVEDLGGIEVKGKNELVPAYRVLGRKVLARRVRGIEGLYAEMVGREVELQILSDVVADLKQGVGRIVCVLGEAGLGKSRLVSEASLVFKDLIGAGGNWYETSSLSYETNQAYGLFQRLIRRVIGIAYDEPLPAVREKLALLAAGLPEERRTRAGQLFEALFGVASEDGGPPLEGEAFKQELLEVVRLWWQTSFSTRPVVLIFDDMHWSDPASIDLLRQLLPLTGEIPLVLICALRSERQAPAWQITIAADEEYRHKYTEISLRPLSDAESNELVNRLLAVAELPEGLRASILERAGGNPFFIEEVVRTLIENGVVIPEDRMVGSETRRYWKATSQGVEFEIPDNLQSLLAARIDRLEDATRGTLQVAAVIGRSFYRRVLQAVDEASAELDKRLGTLLKLDMIREAARLPEVEYVFRNPLTQEAVYKSILLKHRREFHRRVGDAMEALYPKRLEGLYGLLAHHFSLAGQPDKAIDYYRQASRQAISLYAYDEAMRSLRSALDLVEPAGGREIQLLLFEELADVYRLLRDWGSAIDVYQQALELWGVLQGADRLVEVRLHRKIVQGVAELKWSVGLDTLLQANQRRQASQSRLVESLDYTESGPARLENVRVLVALSTDAWRIQEPPDWDAAQRYAQAAVEMAEQLESPAVLSRALGALATVLDGRSLLREQLQVAQQRLAICKDAQLGDIDAGDRNVENFRERIEALRCAGAALAFVGEYDQAMVHLKEAENLAGHGQVIDQQVNAIGLQALCNYRMDRWDEVLAVEEKWRDLEHRYSRERVGET